MPMLKCEDCGLTFDENEIAEWQEDRGEFWGQPCTQTLQGCPHCFSGAIIEYNDEDEDEDDEDDEE